MAEVASFEAVTGKGVTGVLEGKCAGIGNEALMLSLGVAATDLQALDDSRRCSAS